jgi:hypothetical protein
MARLGVESDIAELAIDHKRKGLERLYNFDQAWKLRCEAFAKASDYIAGLLYRAAAEGRVVAIPGRAASTAPSGAHLSASAAAISAYHSPRPRALALVSKVPARGQTLGGVVCGRRLLRFRFLGRSVAFCRQSGRRRCLRQRLSG